MLKTHIQILDPKLTHLRNITDDFGIWQFFENGKIFESEGYALDDSARALIVALEYEAKDLAEVYLGYLEKSLKYNLMIGFFFADRTERVYPSSSDAFGLAFWALAFSIKYGFEVTRCKNLISKMNLSVLNEVEHLRTKAYGIISYSLLNDFKEADKLVKSLVSTFQEKWDWFENKMTYANAILPYSLLIFCSQFNVRDEKILEIIKKSTKNLERFNFIGKIPAPIGSRIWQEKDTIGRDIYGQQPIEAGFFVLLYIEAYKFFKDEAYLDKAREWVEWFYGNNIMKTSLINEDYACADGIDESGIRPNYGAESTIAYLWSVKDFLTLNK